MLVKIINKCWLSYDILNNKSIIPFFYINKNTKYKIFFWKNWIKNFNNIIFIFIL